MVLIAETALSGRSHLLSSPGCASLPVFSLSVLIPLFTSLACVGPGSPVPPSVPNSPETEHTIASRLIHVLSLSLSVRQFVCVCV